jgi:ABC-type transport system involved in multi-copper enzyme maturation permease subunit
MALERGIPNFLYWLLGSPTSSLLVPASWGFLFGTLAICLLLFLVVPFICFVILSLQYGPSEAFYYVARSIFTAVTEDLPQFSPRRTFAVARLAIQEAIRNKILVGFGIFLLLLLIAGMFLDVQNSNPARVYLSFVLTSTNYLVLLMALLLSAFSLPNDIKNRTIYTVVTKPIRASEIVLGRTLGFAAVGTAMLLLMGVISYFFVTWSLSHDHAIDAASVNDESGRNGEVIRRYGETTVDQHHRHTFEVDANGKGRTNTVQGHWHEVVRTDDGKYRVGPPQGHLIARAPIYGQLVIFDRDGKQGKGINVGNEWEYRGYIEGGTPGVQTKAHAVWKFSGVTKDRYPNGLPLELNLRVFRTFKGDIERGVLGELVVRNPNPDAPVKRSGPIVFESKEFVSDRRLIPIELNSEIGGAAGAGKLNLFKDLVDGGEVEVELRCVEPAQYFGVAEPDVYLRPGDASFEANFGKAYLSIWLQMLLVTGFGVTLSTILSGPVALMASISAIVLGFFGQFIRDIATGTAYGGGPIESFIRIITQQNVMTDMEINKILLTIIKGADGVLMHLLQAATYILPDYTQFDTTEFVASGYNIFGALVGEQLVMAIVYFTAVSIAGYFFLKTREIAA